MTDPLKDMAKNLGNAPKGLKVGLKLLAGVAALGYGLTQSVYTGKCFGMSSNHVLDWKLFFVKIIFF